MIKITFGRIRKIYIRQISFTVLLIKVGAKNDLFSLPFTLTRLHLQKLNKGILELDI